eukprot:FR737393.1.p1 GENE.FR737393.1~~FR737393.1.p1  ORF type:complete len:222 (-),score=9.91 FR737393.1:91-756(-)
MPPLSSMEFQNMLRLQAAARAKTEDDIGLVLQRATDAAARSLAAMSSSNSSGLDSDAPQQTSKFGIDDDRRHLDSMASQTSTEHVSLFAGAPLDIRSSHSLPETISDEKQGALLMFPRPVHSLSTLSGWATQNSHVEMRSSNRTRRLAAVKVAKTPPTLLDDLARALEQSSANLRTKNQFKRNTVLRLYSMEEYLAMGCRSNRRLGCGGRPTKSPQRSPLR